jgi:outer membrane lipoprotein-sorting protein
MHRLNLDAGDGWKTLKRHSFHGGTSTLIALLAMLSLCVPALISATQGQPRWTLESVLKQLDEEAKSFRSLTANIEQTKVTVVVNDKSTESGQILVRHDDRMRIEFTQPNPRTILRTGNDLYLYNPKIKKLDQFDLGKNRALVDQFLLLGFGTSGAELQKGYLVTLLGEEEMDKHQVLKLELTPKNEDARRHISKIHMWMDESTWLSTQQQFFETGSGDYFIIRYTNLVRNPKIPDDQFKPRWPKGVKANKP